MATEPQIVQPAEEALGWVLVTDATGASRAHFFSEPKTEAEVSEIVEALQKG